MGCYDHVNTEMNSAKLILRFIFVKNLFKAENQEIFHEIITALSDTCAGGLAYNVNSSEKCVEFCETQESKWFVLFNQPLWGNFE